ncbi:MAG: 3-methyl-2-oxobutanoate hydroxymethyltransferase, partial [Thermodesulfobacteriota bacterium]
MSKSQEKKITAPDIRMMKLEGKKFPVLTAYGFQMARLLDRAGIPLILVGDSVGMVEAGYDSTLPVTMDEMVYHTR